MGALVIVAQRRSPVLCILICLLCSSPAVGKEGLDASQVSPMFVAALRQFDEPFTNDNLDDCLPEGAGTSFVSRWEAALAQMLEQKRKPMRKALRAVAAATSALTEDAQGRCETVKDHKGA